MRRLLLFLSVLLLGASWAAAQDNSSTTNPTSASPSQSASATSDGGEMTVQGCVSGSNGSYTLSDKNGTTYQLTGDAAKLSEHVGHEVKITGTSSGSPSSGGTATGTTGDSQKTLQVTSVKQVSKTCQSGGMAK